MQQIKEEIDHVEVIMKENLRYQISVAKSEIRRKAFIEIGIILSIIVAIISALGWLRSKYSV